MYTKCQTDKWVLCSINKHSGPAGPSSQTGEAWGGSVRKQGLPTDRPAEPIRTGVRGSGSGLARDNEICGEAGVGWGMTHILSIRGPPVLTAHLKYAAPLSPEPMKGGLALVTGPGAECGALSNFPERDRFRPCCAHQSDTSLGPDRRRRGLDHGTA
ncbi:hypothetical protein AAFF_G00304610 [Aldrovandia affinis]|uniref:Uncharacterized protein n=1 Tax=Aldrovandia affinis TaxID=143900 RepID=A0AAD7WRD8_9TELE|nr:hypothetical protein AAFF_G00304610 [Aldrovandia affinis]